MSSLRRFDLLRLPAEGWLAGVDEAGRGALAGPVVAASVFLERSWFEERRGRRRWAEVNDSKQLAPACRERLCALLEAECAAGRMIAASGSASVFEIDRDNILGATRLAMRRALETACPAAWTLPPAEPAELFERGQRTREPAVTGKILIDGKPLRPFPFAHEAVVQGDGRSLVIALASILAKVTRDRLMEELDGLFPQYGFAEHKGYGTAAHRAALREHGPCAAHRPLFLRKVLGTGADASGAPSGAVGQAELFAS